MKIKTIGLICFLLIGCNTWAFGKGSDLILNQQIQSILDQERLKYHLGALSMSINLPDEKQARNYVSGFYSLTNKKKITPDTLFQIGSITKTFTASMIYKLIEEKKLNLNDKLTKWLPQYPRWKNITIKNLLTHTSGIENYTHSEEFDDLLRKNPQQYLPIAELVARAYHAPDLAPPGQKYNYNNTEYLLLGMILEKIYNKSLQEIFDEYLHLYHLQNTFYAPAGYPGKVSERIAHGYNRDGTFKNNEDVTFFSLSFGHSSGAMIATAEDITRWLNLLFANKIINNASLTNMTKIISGQTGKPVDLEQLSPPELNQELFAEIGIGSGLGLVYFKNDGFNWVHTGGTLGYESFYAFNPCKGSTLVFMYSAKPKEQLIFIKIANKIFQTLNKSKRVKQQVNDYRENHAIPSYCHVNLN